MDTRAIAELMRQTGCSWEEAESLVGFNSDMDAIASSMLVSQRQFEKTAGPQAQAFSRQLQQKVAAAQAAVWQV